MYISKQTLDKIRKFLSESLSKHRYTHTLGVEETAAKLGEVFLPDKLSEIRAAALLHDVSKEYSAAEHLELLKNNENITSDDYDTEAAYHAFSAPEVIKRKFPECATDDILSAAFKHTTGDCDMSLFDKIIFISDYIEPGRTYYQCTILREKLLSDLVSAKDAGERLNCLDSAVLTALDNTIRAISERGGVLNKRTLLAKKKISKSTL